MSRTRIATGRRRSSCCYRSYATRSRLRCRCPLLEARIGALRCVVLRRVVLRRVVLRRVVLRRVSFRWLVLRRVNLGTHLLWRDSCLFRILRYTPFECNAVTDHLLIGSVAGRRT